MASTQPQTKAEPTNEAANLISALGKAFKGNGSPLSGDQLAQWLHQNMAQLSVLVKEGKLTQGQILALKEFADKHKTTTTDTSNQPGPSTTATAMPNTTTPTQTYQASTAYKNSNLPLLSEIPAAIGTFPISQTLATQSTGAGAWPQVSRPTLTGGVAGGRISGSPAQMTRGTEETLNLDDGRAPRRKNTAGDQSMRRSIQDLVSSIDPSVKIEPDVEDLLLDIADEFIDSVTNFSCRLAKHRGGDTLEVRDLQLHLERNHNIRIPGFQSDETRLSMSQTTITPVPPPTTGAGGTKKGGGQATHSMTLRSQRLAQVQQAKRESKLL